MKNLRKSYTDNRANQLNPRHPAYHQSRGAPAHEAAALARLSKNAHEVASPRDSGAMDDIPAPTGGGHRTR